MRRTVETFHPGSSSVSGREAAAIRLGRTKIVIIAILDWVEVRLERQRTRRTLLNLSDAQLKDIGLSRSEAHREGMRWFWD